MSKAEERALERFPVHEGASKEWTEMHLKSICTEYIEGYHQAEKDLELTWEDMMLIHKCIKDAMNYHLYKMMEGVEGQKVVYQEVLKRFKAQKDAEAINENALLYNARLEGIEIGKAEMKQQMMKNAIDGVITFDYYGDDDKIYGCTAHDSFCLEELGLKDGDKVKLIIIKED